MKLLVLAYEFPPILSGQSVRWFHLSNALADLEAEVHILAPAFPDRYGFGSRMHDRVFVHRCSAGPFVGFAARLSSHLERQRRTEPRVSGPSWGKSATHDPGVDLYGALEWIYRGLRVLLNHTLVPDVRTEWFPFAWHVMQRLMARYRYDVVVSSHEPGVTLLLGLAAQRRWRLPWLVDLGDPVVGPNSPRWRHKLDRSLERLVCRRADRLLVTCPEMVDLLVQRHGREQEGGAFYEKVAVVEQGFPLPPGNREAEDNRPAEASTSNDRVLTLVFTGTFYKKFRSPEALLEALAELELPDLRLVVAGSTGTLHEVRTGRHARIRVLGMIDHIECLELQRQATVLLNVGNRQSYQVPGKLFEYFGAQRPILHLVSGSKDPGAELVESLSRGIITSNEKGAIKAALTQLHVWWRAGELDTRFDLSTQRVRKYSWPTLAGQVWKQCKELEQNRHEQGRRVRPGL